MLDNMTCKWPLTLPASEGRGLQPQLSSLLAALQRFSRNFLTYCRHSKQMLYVVIYQGCGKLTCATSVSSLLAATVTSVWSYPAASLLCAASMSSLLATTVHYTASLLCAVTSQAYLRLASGSCSESEWQNPTYTPSEWGGTITPAIRREHGFVIQQAAICLPLLLLTYPI
jgi:hypothetical protein